MSGSLDNETVVDPLARRREQKARWRAEHKAAIAEYQRQYQRRILEAGTIKCDICGRAFPTKQALTYHKVMSKAHQTT